MAVLRKVRQGRGIVYYIDFRYQGVRRRKSSGTSDKGLARDILQELKRRMAISNFQIEDLNPANITLRDLKMEYLDGYAKINKAPGSIDIDKQAMDDLIGRFGPNATARSISVRDVSAFIAWLKEKKVVQEERRDDDGNVIRPKQTGLKATTVNIKIRTLRAIFNWALREENKYIEKNPFANQKPIRSEVRQNFTMSVEEIHALLAEARRHARGGKRFEQLVLFTLMTAGRRGEGIGLTWGRVDFPQRLITFTKTKGKKVRSIPMNDELYALLKEVREGASKTGPDDRVFPFDERALSRQFKRYAKAAGLREELHFHCLRHTAANNMLSHNVNLKIIQDVLGHSDIATSMIYLNTMPDALRPAMDTLSIKKYRGPDEGQPGQ
jgi:integrase/recombinase XerD